MTEHTRQGLLSRGFFVSSLALITVVAALYFYNIIGWVNYPNFGFGFRTATGIHVVGVVMTNGAQSGLKQGDKILTLNGEKYTTINEARQMMNRKIGEQNKWLVERDGEKYEIIIKNVPSGFKFAFMKSGLPFLLGLIFMGIGIIVFLMKPHQRASWIFFLFTATFGIFLTFLYKLGVVKPAGFETVNIFAYAFMPAAFIHLALSFPEERAIIAKRPWIQAIPYIFSALLLIVIRAQTPTMTDAPKIWLLATVAYMAIGILFFLGSCLQLRLRSKSVMVKQRARMILLGFAIAASVPLSDFIINAVFNVYILPGFNFYLPFFLAIPAFIGYSIVKHDLFDIDTIIKRTYGYVLTTGTLAGLYGLFVLISNAVFGRFAITQSKLFPLVFMLAVVFFFNPIRNRVQRIIDRLFYRLEYDYQETVQKISETMRSLLKLDEIGKSIMDTALGAMFIDCGCVMLMNQKQENYQCLSFAGECVMPDSGRQTVQGCSC